MDGPDTNDADSGSGSPVALPEIDWSKVRVLAPWRERIAKLVDKFLNRPKLGTILLQILCNGLPTPYNLTVTVLPTGQTEAQFTINYGPVPRAQTWASLEWSVDGGPWSNAHNRSDLAMGGVHTHTTIGMNLNTFDWDEICFRAFMFDLPSGMSGCYSNTVCLDRCNGIPTPTNLASTITYSGGATHDTLLHWTCEQAGVQRFEILSAYINAQTYPYTPPPVSSFSQLAEVPVLLGATGIGNFQHLHSNVHGPRCYMVRALAADGTQGCLTDPESVIFYIP